MGDSEGDLDVHVPKKRAVEQRKEERKDMVPVKRRRGRSPKPKAVVAVNPSEKKEKSARDNRTVKKNAAPIGDDVFARTAFAPPVAFSRKRKAESQDSDAPMDLKDNKADNRLTIGAKPRLGTSGGRPTVPKQSPTPKETGKAHGLPTWSALPGPSTSAVGDYAMSHARNILLQKEREEEREKERRASKEVMGKKDFMNRGHEKVKDYKEIHREAIWASEARLAEVEERNKNLQKMVNDGKKERSTLLLKLEEAERKPKVELESEESKVVKLEKINEAMLQKLKDQEERAAEEKDKLQKKEEESRELCQELEQMKKRGRKEEELRLAMDIRARETRQKNAELQKKVEEGEKEKAGLCKKLEEAERKTKVELASEKWKVVEVVKNNNDPMFWILKELARRTAEAAKKAKASLDLEKLKVVQLEREGAAMLEHLKEVEERAVKSEKKKAEEMKSVQKMIAELEKEGDNARQLQTEAEYRLAQIEQKTKTEAEDCEKKIAELETENNGLRVELSKAEKEQAEVGEKARTEVEAKNLAILKLENEKGELREKMEEETRLEVDKAVKGAIANLASMQEVVSKVIIERNICQVALKRAQEQMANEQLRAKNLNHVVAGLKRETDQKDRNLEELLRENDAKSRKLEESLKEIAKIRNEASSYSDYLNAKNRHLTADNDNMRSKLRDSEKQLAQVPVMKVAALKDERDRLLQELEEEKQRLQEASQRIYVLELELEKLEEENQKHKEAGQTSSGISHCSLSEARQEIPTMSGRLAVVEPSAASQELQDLVPRLTSPKPAVRITLVDVGDRLEIRYSY